MRFCVFPNICSLRGYIEKGRMKKEEEAIALTMLSLLFMFMSADFFINNI
jgi:hypothetical protein